MNSLGCLHCDFIFMFVLNSLYYGEAEIFFPPKGRRLSQSFLTYLTVLSLKKKNWGRGKGDRKRTQSI